MSQSQVQTIWLCVVGIIVGVLPLVIVLSGIVPGLITLLSRFDVNQTPFGILLACNDAGNLYYLNYQWLLQASTTSQIFTTINSIGFANNLTYSGPRYEQRPARLAPKSSVKESKQMDEYTFLATVWENEDLKTGLDFTKLYRIGHNLSRNTKIIQYSGNYGCPSVNQLPAMVAAPQSVVFEIRPSFDWYPGGVPELTNEGVIYHVSSEEFRRRSCVLGVSQLSSQMTDNEWCADLTTPPGVHRRVPFIEPRGTNYSVKVNVTSENYGISLTRNTECDIKPLALNDRTSYYDSPFSSDLVSLHALDVDQGPSLNAMAVVLARSPLFWGTGNVANYSISLIYICHSFAGDPTALGSTIFIDYDTKKPLKALGGAKFIRMWNQIHPTTRKAVRMMAYITICGRNTHAIVIAQLIPGPVLETGGCTKSIFPPRSYYVKVVRQLSLSSRCADPLTDHNCAIYCQKIYDFSVRTSHPDIDDSDWIPTNESYWLMTLTICSTGWRIDRIRLPFIKSSDPGAKVPEFEADTRFLWQPSVDPNTRIQFDNFAAPGETRSKVDGIWHSQIAQMLITVNTTLERPYKEYCAYADRNMLWELRIEEFMNTKACLRRWLNYPSRVPHAIRTIRYGMSAMAVRNFGLFLFNTSCSYCDVEAFPHTKIPRVEQLILSRFDGITGDPHVVNLSPIDVIGDTINPQILYYWDAGNNSLRWIKVRGLTEVDWGVIHTAKTLFVPRFATDLAPMSMAWTTALSGERLVLGSYYGRNMLARILKVDENCTLMPMPIGQTRSPMGAIYATSDGSLLVWSEPLRESLLIANTQRVISGDIPSNSSINWRRLTCLNGKVFSSIGYSARKKQIFMSAPEEGTLYSMGIESENYNIIFRAADKLGVGDILKALRPNNLYVDQISDAVYFTALPAINITSYYNASWGNATLYDQMFYTAGQYGWKRADDTGRFTSTIIHDNDTMFFGQNTYPVNEGATNLANSIWVLRPNFSVKTLMADPAPYYTNSLAHIVTIYGHKGNLICVERRVTSSRETKFRVIQIPLMAFSPEIYTEALQIDVTKIQVLVDWSTGNVNSILAPLQELNLYDSNPVPDESGPVNRAVFGWIAFGLLIIHLSVATAYNFKMTREPLNRHRDSGNT